MQKPPKETDAEKRVRLLRELHQDQRERAAGYRSRALKLLPHVCGNCGREFSDKRLRELTVHHRDHNFRNNPPDGSNWELLCLYCHDYEHERHTGNGSVRPAATVGEVPPPVANPFASLDQLLGKAPPP